MIKTRLEVSYSQGPEEKIILSNISGFPNGKVLDIGAGDGKTFSNSLALIEHGWSGILIEPSPHAFKELVKLHGKNERLKLLNVAIGAEERFVKFYECDDTLYSTTSEKKAEALKKDGKSLVEYWVLQTTLARLTNEFGASCDVLSIDAEGASVDILFSIPAWHPKCIVVEHDGRAVEISGWARERHYEVGMLTAENVLLVRQ